MRLRKVNATTLEDFYWCSIFGSVLAELHVGGRPIEDNVLKYCYYFILSGQNMFCQYI